MSRADVVLAAMEGGPILEASLSAFAAEVAGAGDLIVVDGSRDGISVPDDSRIRLIRRPDRLAPELWGIGLESSVAEFVAFSTTQMVPRRGWLAGLVEEVQSRGLAGVGGPIAAGPGLSRVDRALYLMRFASYAPPVPDSSTFDPPGDNALYRRSALEAVRDSWREGFWEIEVHRSLRSLGVRLGSAPGALVEFLGGASRSRAIAHRVAHARRFGAWRGRGDSLVANLARTATAPAVPAVLLARIARSLSLREEPIGPWLGALPDLSLFLTAWSMGEAAGRLLGPGARTFSRGVA